MPGKSLDNDHHELLEDHVELANIDLKELSANSDSYVPLCPFE